MEYPNLYNSDDIASSMKFSIIRQLLQGDENEQISCIELLKEELFMSSNINIINLLSL